MSTVLRNRDMSLLYIGAHGSRLWKLLSTFSSVVPQFVWPCQLLALRKHQAVHPVTVTWLAGPNPSDLICTKRATPLVPEVCVVLDTHVPAPSLTRLPNILGAVHPLPQQDHSAAAGMGLGITTRLASHGKH